MAAGKMNRAAINNGATWGTLPAFTAAGCGIVYKSFSPGGMSRLHGPIGATGMAVAGVANKGGIDAGEATLTFPFNFVQHPRLFGGILSDVISGPVGNITTHTMTGRLTASSSFHGGAFEVPNPAGAGGSALYQVVTSFVGTRLVISADIGTEIDCALGMLCRDITPTTSVTMSVPAAPNASLFPTMQAGDADFFALATQGTVPANLGISGFTLTLPIPRAGGDHSTSSEYIGLPDESGIQEPTLEVRVPNFIPIARLTDFTAQTLKNVLFTFPSVTIGSDVYTCTIKLPCIAPKSFDSPDPGPGKMSHTLTYEILSDPNGAAHASCDTTGGAAYEIVIGNTTATDYDAAL